LFFRAANKKGFANARSVRILVEAAMRNASRRQKKEAVDATTCGLSLSASHSKTLTMPDVLGTPIDPSTSPLIKELMGMVGLHDVKESVKGTFSN
jgi:hypothetical protein